MTDERGPIARVNDRALRVFILVAFGVPWIGWITLTVTGVDPQEPLGQALFYSGGACSVAGLVAAFLSGGSAGLRSLLAKCVSARASLAWWAIALLLPVVVDLGAIIIYGWSHGGLGEFHASGFLTLVAPASLVAILSGPLGEEIGWRGFLLPRCLANSSPLRASVVVGLTWVVWHLPLYYDGIFADAALLSLFTVDILCSSIILTAMFLRTGGSVLLAMVFHWTSNVGQPVAGAMFPSIAVEDVALYFGFRELFLIGATVLVMWSTRRESWRRAAPGTHAS
jgi:membrane protease YdiL (CAAX protease family)